MNRLDVAIIGGGPAGMAAAIQLYQKGITNILVIERNPYLGGILNQCIHPGFGLTYYREELTGPQYARKMEKEILHFNIPLALNTSVINIDDNKIITTSSEKGLQKYKCKTILMATGCRERTRENIEIPGSRPSGIFSAGLAQKLINTHNLKIGSKVIIQGSGDIGLIMARRLALEGYQVIKVFEKLPYLSGLLRNKIQCLDDFNISLELSSSISLIEGEKRVTGVQVMTSDGLKHFECDTILFSVGLIPELDLLYNKKINGIFICGNARTIHDLADNASLEAEQFAFEIARFLADQKFNEPLLPKSLRNKSYNQTFFDNKKGKIICTLCPKACTVTETTYGCPKGKDFFGEESLEKRRILTTSLKGIPLHSLEKIPISKALKIVKRIQKCEFNKNSQIVLNEQEVFDSCPPPLV